MIPEIKYIGKSITIKSLKDFIVDSKLSDKKNIILNSDNFNDIVLEYLDFYGESMSVPYSLIGIFIFEDESKKVPLNRIGIVNETENDVENYIYEETFDLYDGEKAYKCGFCGSIVDKNGNELFDEERERIINYIQKFENPIINKTHGKCCEKVWRN